jgi:sterol desaturase/sphingolipid hydroxylase (fatty acid hydroxylase superfamily)
MHESGKASCFRQRGAGKRTRRGDFLESTSRQSERLAKQSERQSNQGGSSGSAVGRDAHRVAWKEVLALGNSFDASMTAAIYLGELFFASALAIVLLVISTSSPSIIIVRFCCGLVAWTLAEYITHRFVLHAIAPVQHGIHHARPRDAVDKIFWQIWLAFAVLYPMLGGAIMAGVLVAYAWYLLVHYCAHHHSTILPASVLKHHLDHHRFANRNYGVTTKFWDRVFGTMLR